MSARNNSTGLRSEGRGTWTSRDSRGLLRVFTFLNVKTAAIFKLDPAIRRFIMHTYIRSGQRHSELETTSCSDDRGEKGMTYHRLQMKARKTLRFLELGICDGKDDGGG